MLTTMPAAGCYGYQSSCNFILLDLKNLSGEKTFASKEQLTIGNTYVPYRKIADG